MNKILKAIESKKIQERVQLREKILKSADQVRKSIDAIREVSFKTINSPTVIFHTEEMNLSELADAEKKIISFVLSLNDLQKIVNEEMEKITISKENLLSDLGRAIISTSILDDVSREFNETEKEKEGGE